MNAFLTALPSLNRGQRLGSADTSYPDLIFSQFSSDPSSRCCNKILQTGPQLLQSTFFPIN
jgi:hypothetical protein